MNSLHMYNYVDGVEGGQTWSGQIKLNELRPMSFSPCLTLHVLMYLCYYSMYTNVLV